MATQLEIGRRITLSSAVTVGIVAAVVVFSVMAAYLGCVSTCYRASQLPANDGLEPLSESGFNVDSDEIFKVKIYQGAGMAVQANRAGRQAHLRVLCPF